MTGSPSAIANKILIPSLFPRIFPVLRIKKMGTCTGVPRRHGKNRVINEFQRECRSRLIFRLLSKSNISVANCSMFTTYIVGTLMTVFLPITCPSSPCPTVFIFSVYMPHLKNAEMGIGRHLGYDSEKQAIGKTQLSCWILN